MTIQLKYLLIIVFTFFLGCNVDIDGSINSIFNKNADIKKRSDLIGEYVANHPLGKDFLILKPDGTYIHKHTHISGEIFEDSDKWELVFFEFENNVPRISFHHFSHSWEKKFWEQKEIKRTKEGTWDALVKNYWGKIRININGDLGYFFEKKDGSKSSDKENG